MIDRDTIDTCILKRGFRIKGFGKEGCGREISMALLSMMVNGTLGIIMLLMV